MPEFIDTVTKTAVSSCGGAVQEIILDDTIMPVVSLIPNLHTASAPTIKLVPVTVTSVPPFTGPLCGEMETMVGVVMYLKDVATEEGE